MAKSLSLKRTKIPDNNGISNFLLLVIKYYCVLNNTHFLTISCIGSREVKLKSRLTD